MSEIEVVPVRSWLDRRRFIDFLWSFYRDDPNWMPPLRMNQREMLNFSRHPFYDTAEIQSFLARRDGQIVGRISAIVNREHLRFHNDGVGFFGFFESIDDPQVASALLDAARNWLRGKGLLKMRGPANPSMNYECGLLVDGFDSPPVFMMTYNSPYYERLLTSYGFQSSHEMYAYIGSREQLPELQARLASSVIKAQEFCNATIRPISKKSFKADVELFLSLYNASMDVNWGFVPFTQSELRAMAKSLQFLLIPELTLVAEVDGRGVGIVFGLPDYNPRIRHINGRLLPFGVFHLLNKKRDFRMIRVVSINVDPSFHRWGLGLVLMAGLTPKALELGVQGAEFSWVSHDNKLARAGLEKGGAKIYKTYRMYDRDISAG